MKKVSIIVPVYNVGEYLQKCLDSILQQKFVDYEIICVDDASTDNSKDILDIYEKEYDLIQVIRHAENRGLSATRNTGLKHAVGKYVWFIDSDDMIQPASLSELFDIAEKNETDMVCFQLAFSGDEKINKVQNICVDNEKVCTGKEFLITVAYDKRRSDSACIRFIKRSFLIKNQISFYEGILHEDALFTFLCIVQAERIININRVYYICNRRAASITAQKTRSSAESNFVIMMQLIVYWYTHNFTEEENDAMKSYVFDRYKAYQYYSRFGTRTEELEVGNKTDKALYDILYNMKTDKMIAFDQAQLEHIKNVKHVIVYGAAHHAADVVDILREKGIKINRIAVNSMDFNPTVFCDIPVDTIEHISNQIKKDVVIILGVSYKISGEVKNQLEEMGYEDIVVPEYK